MPARTGNDDGSNPNCSPRRVETHRNSERQPGRGRGMRHLRVLVGVDAIRSMDDGQ